MISWFILYPTNWFLQRIFIQLLVELVLHELSFDKHASITELFFKVSAYVIAQALASYISDIRISTQMKKVSKELSSSFESSIKKYRSADVGIIHASQIEITVYGLEEMKFAEILSIVWICRAWMIDQAFIYYGCAVLSVDVCFIAVQFVLGG